MMVMVNSTPGRHAVVARPGSAPGSAAGRCPEPSRAPLWCADSPRRSPPLPLCGAAPHRADDVPRRRRG